MRPYLVAEADEPRGYVIQARIRGLPQDEPPLYMHVTALEDVKAGDRLYSVEGLPGTVMVDRTEEERERWREWQRKFAALPDGPGRYARPVVVPGDRPMDVKESSTAP